MRIELIKKEKAIEGLLAGAQEDLLYHRSLIKCYPDPCRERSKLKQSIKIDELVIKQCQDELKDRKEKKEQRKNSASEA